MDFYGLVAMAVGLFLQMFYPVFVFLSFNFVFGIQFFADPSQKLTGHVILYYPIFLQMFE